MLTGSSVCQSLTQKIGGISIYFPPIRLMLLIFFRLIEEISSVGELTTLFSVVFEDADDADSDPRFKDLCSELGSKKSSLNKLVCTLVFQRPYSGCTVLNVHIH